MTKKFFLIVFVFIMSCGGSSTTTSSTLTFATQSLSIQTSAKTLNLTVEVADNSAKRAQGLMNRQSLDDDKGMLFIFNSEGVHSFWMKNTYVSLDILWIDSNKKIVYIAENTTPLSEESIVPTAESLYVLEVVAGFVKDNGVNVGDSLSF